MGKEMIPENEITYELLASSSFLNQHNQLKPYAYQILFEQMAEQHLAKLNINVDGTMEYGLAWALISMSVEVVHPIEKGMALFGTTWHSEHRRPYFRRELQFKDAGGRVMFQGATHSVLLDLERRTVFRKNEVPFPIHEPTGVFLIEASPGFKMDADLVPVAERVAQASHIDCLGHVNNCRYGEFAYDVFTDEEQRKLNRLKRMDIHFLSELRAGDRFTMRKASEGDRIYIQGYNNTKGVVSFNIALSFHP